MTHLCQTKISHDIYHNLSGPLYKSEVFGELRSTQLSVEDILKTYSSWSDVYVSHDWGRELGLDNHGRVIEIGSFLGNKGLHANIDTFGQMDDDSMRQGIECSSCGIVFITRRYVRRIQEQHYIAKEFNYMVSMFGYQRIIFVIMEKRISKVSVWAELLNINPDAANQLMVVHMFADDTTDQVASKRDTLLNFIMSIIHVTIQQFSAVLRLKSFELLFDAVKSNNSSGLSEYFLTCDKDGLNENDIKDADGCSFLYHASAQGYVETVDILLSSKQFSENYINSSNNLGCTALFAAAAQGHIEVASRLIRAGAKVDQYNNLGHSPLYEAALNGHLDIVELFVRAKADINLADNDGLLPAEVAATPAIADMLLELTTVHRELLRIAKAGHVQELQELIANQPRLNINFANEDGRTALFLAANEGNTAMVAELLAAGADVHIKDNWLETALTTTPVYASDASVVKLLLDAKSDINWKNVWGNSALFNCYSRGLSTDGENDGVVELLISRGVDVNMSGNFRDETMTPLQVAYKTCRISDMQRLLEAGAVLDDATAANMLRDYSTFFRPSLLASQHTSSEISSFTFNLTILSIRDYAVWFTLLQLLPGDAEQDMALQRFVLAQVKRFPQLANVKDLHGRVALNVATKANKLAINSLFLWHGRYKILDQHPEHVSATCYVYKALDENTVDESGNPIKVALKLIRFKSAFLREISTRDRDFDANYVVNVLTTFPNLEHLVVQKCGNYNEDDLLLGSEPTVADLVAALSSYPEDCFAESKAYDKSTPVVATTNIITIDTVSTTPITSPGLAVSGSDGNSEDALLADNSLLRRLRAGESVPHLTRYEAEMMFCIVMPMADRNMFVCLKQERFAGKVENIGEIVYIFQQLVKCVEHIHQKGILHADLKTLNIVRRNFKWQLIDLDAASVIGVDHVGVKSSSAYIPPEAVYANKSLGCAMVRSAANLAALQQRFYHLNNGNAGVSFDFLIAHPSFDVWSLGCILYQMCTTDVRPLFQGGQDDNLTAELGQDNSNNLFCLAEWTDELKATRLASVIDPLARNLLSQMLHRDPQRRPSIHSILNHTFISKKQFTRLVGQPATYDVFISYRVAADLSHAELLYQLLIEAGMRVWWDKKCLKAGENWEQGFCRGLISSRYFVCLLSRAAINDEKNSRQNFAILRENSPCDNLLLEWRLALELRKLGLIEKIFPVLIGDKIVIQPQPPLELPEVHYSNFFATSCLPRELPAVAVVALEHRVAHYMESEGLGSPVLQNQNNTGESSSGGSNSVATVVAEVLKCNGAVIEGDLNRALTKAVQYLLSDYPSQGAGVVDGSSSWTTTGSSSESKVLHIRKLVAQEVGGHSHTENSAGPVMSPNDSPIQERRLPVATESTPLKSHQ